MAAVWCTRPASRVYSACNAAGSMSGNSCMGRGPGKLFPAAQSGLDSKDGNDMRAGDERCKSSAQRHSACVKNTSRICGDESRRVKNEYKLKVPGSRGPEHTVT